MQLSITSLFQENKVIRFEFIYSRWIKYVVKIEDWTMDNGETGNIGYTGRSQAKQEITKQNTKKMSK
jgi:hypothetical protein